MTRAERFVRGDGAPDSGITARLPFVDLGVFNIAQAAPAVGFGDEDAEDAEFGELRPEFDGEVRRFVPLGNMRLQLGFSKFTDGTFDLLLFFVQLEIHLPSGTLT